MTARSYATPVAFKEALEQRLRSAGLPDLSRRRQLLVFDRLLARVAAAFGDAAVLKGGVGAGSRYGTGTTTPFGRTRALGYLTPLEFKRKQCHPQAIEQRRA